MTMKAIVKTQKGEGFVEYIERPIPNISPNEVLLRIENAAICGTDLHIFHDQFPYWPPVILGHEFSATIEKTGSQVTDWCVGDRVVGEPHTLSCGSCFYCRSGNIQNCQHKRSPGWGIDGCFARYMRFPDPRLLHRLPDSVSFQEGALIEPLANVITDVVERGGLSAGDTVAVIGPGPIGLMACMVARAAGASQVLLVGTDADEQIRSTLALSLGIADTFINAQREDVFNRVESSTEGLGVNMAIEASGSVAGIETAIQVCRKYATVTCIGLPSKEPIPFPYSQAMKKVLSIIGNLSTSYTSWDRSIALVASRTLDLTPLITEVVSLESWEESFLKLEQKKAIKILFSPEG